MACIMACMCLCVFVCVCVCVCDQYLLTYKRTFTSYGGKAFANFVPKLWNKLPVTLRSADKLKKFKSLLKTHLFTH